MFVEEYLRASDVGAGELAYFLGLLCSCLGDLALFVDPHCFSFLYADFHISVKLRALGNICDSARRHVNVIV